MRIAALVLLAGACAHPKAVAVPAPPPLPEPVSVTVRGEGPLEELVPQTEQHARARLVAQRHEVSEAAAHAVEIEISSVGGVVRNGVYEYCVRLAGRVLRDGERVAAADTVKEKCDVVRLSNGTRDPAAAAYTFALAVTTAVTLEKAAPNAQSRLYVAALDELTDSLGRQAVRRRD